MSSKKSEKDLLPYWEQGIFCQMTSDLPPLNPSRQTNLVVTFPLPIERGLLEKAGAPWPPELENGTILPLQAWVRYVAPQAVSSPPAEGEGNPELPARAPVGVIAVLAALPDTVTPADGRRYLPMREDAPLIGAAVEMLIALWRHRGSPAEGDANVMPCHDTSSSGEL